MAILTVPEIYEEQKREVKVIKRRREAASVCRNAVQTEEMEKLHIK